MAVRNQDGGHNKNEFLEIDFSIDLIEIRNLS